MSALIAEVHAYSYALGFISGAVAVIALEFFGLRCLIRRGLCA